MNAPRAPNRLRPQFSLRTGFIVTTVCAALFAAFRALGISASTAGFLAGVLALSLLAGASLILVIARSFEEPGDDS
jgi:hypothetical protein